MCDYAFACLELDRPWDHWRAGHVLETFARGRGGGHCLHVMMMYDWCLCLTISNTKYVCGFACMLDRYNLYLMDIFFTGIHIEYFFSEMQMGWTCDSNRK